MLKFLKSIFKLKEEDIEKKQFKLDSLRSFVEERETTIKKELNTKIFAIKQIIDKELNTIEQDMQKLEEAKLRNPNIPEREKHFMQGNREAFVRSTNILKIKLKKETIDNENANWYADLLLQDISVFDKNTARQFMILKEFFSHEVINIASRIKTIENSAKKIKEVMHTSNLPQLHNLKEDINKLGRKKTHLKELEKNREDEKNKINSLKDTRESTNKKLQDIKTSKEFADLKSLEEKRDEIDKKLRGKEGDFNHNLFALEAALKKYERITLNYQQLIQGYIKNPIKTLLKDNNKDLTKILEKMKEAILSQNIELKDKKKEKTITLIGKIDRSYLDNLAEEYTQLKEELTKHKEALEKAPLTKQLVKLKILKEDTEDQIALIKEEEIKKKIQNEENTIKKLKETIEISAKSLFHEEIVLEI